MGRLSRCVCTAVMAGEDAAFSSLSNLLALSTSTAVGEGAVVKAASFGACEPSGRGETDCSTDGAMETDGFAVGAESERGCFACPWRSEERRVGIECVCRSTCVRVMYKATS